MSEFNMQFASPIMTLERFAEVSGIPLRTVEDKAAKGELPTLKTNLMATRNGARYINVVKLYQMAAADSFEHPRSQTSTKKLNRA